ncbi:hypothetical protein [Streptosporangium sp. KLBMP 9127]|nr:hypothetical protein [Streptosporangium sp. KLBMP 9127]
MRKIVGRLASIATVALAASAALVMTTPAAQAANYWSSNAAQYATKVGTLKTKTVYVAGRNIELQLRAGKYGSYTSIWARTPKKTSANGNHLIIQVYNPKSGKWDSRWKSIKNTTYTDGHRAIAGYHYRACAKQPGLGGSPAKCTSSWVV